MKGWRVTELGAGRVRRQDDEIRLEIPAAGGDSYHDAQISDYADRRDFRNAPPLRLSLRARANGDLRGTAGFGFWNHAFAPGERGFRLPQALWFFYSSPPGNIALAKGVRGHGWKAATIDARNPRFLALLPAAPVGFLLMRSRRLVDALWPIGQSALGVRETLLDESLLADFHTYSIDWHADGAVFSVDGAVVLRTDAVRGSRLGFIAWLDNQYAIVTPQGRFGHGMLDITRPQSLRLRDISITAM